MKKKAIVLTQDTEWLRALFLVRDEVALIIDMVSLAEATGKWEIKFEAFSEALEKLPSILQRLKTISEPTGVNMIKFRDIQELEERALDTFIESCKLSMEQLEGPNRFLLSTIILKVSLAKRYWDSSARESAVFLKK